MLSPVIDVFRLRQYFNVITGARDLAGLMRKDAAFLHAIRRALVTLPFENTLPVETQPFPDAQHERLDRALGTRRFGLVATGGSGALASVVGAWRALEETGITPDVVSVCSGSTLFGFPLAAGLPADEVAEFTLSLRTADYVDVNWPGLASVVLDVGRGFAGMVVGERIEETYRRLLGDMTLGELPIPCYAPIWNIEDNRLEYVGPRTHPDLPVARAIRAAIAIPLFIDPVEIDGLHWCDGGIVDIFPVRPVLEIESRCDVVLAINGFYPPNFEGEDARGWREQRASVLRIASQVRTSQQIELARTNLERLRAETDVAMIDPVPYTEVMGAGFYKHFIDRSAWPDFMRAGRAETLHALHGWSALQPAKRPSRKATTNPSRKAATKPSKPSPKSATKPSRKSTTRTSPKSTTRTSPKSAARRSQRPAAEGRNARPKAATRRRAPQA
ncbi:MAG TPA: patatin-like phospholipase family protein [Candidatus Dormibacteraeota bacterium]|nr:patatin-like phospholipase family protein [Candidatus Dormibacteraeota bacterium]